MSAGALHSSLPGAVVVASGNACLREQIMHTLDCGPFPVRQAVGGADALSQLENDACQLLLLDRQLPDLDPDELMQTIQTQFPQLAVVMIDPDTGQPLAGYAAAQRQRPALAPPLLHLLQKLYVSTRCSTAELPDPLAEDPDDVANQALPGMVGRSQAMMRVYRLAGLVAPRNTTALLMGPTGTGKELVANAIHQLSPRAARPFVVVNCAAIPESLLESELFGHVRGAFTGAVQSQLGRIHAAQGGTLFLDEVGELPLALQAKLLRFLEQREVQRLGSPDVFRVDVRIVAATNANLAQRVTEHHFRDDLYYRLMTFPLELPSLAERPADILPLARHFLNLLARQSNSAATLALTPEAAHLLENHSWEGNVRELQNVLERASILADGAPSISAHHFCFPSIYRQPSSSTIGRRGREFSEKT